MKIIKSSFILVLSLFVLTISTSFGQGSPTGVRDLSTADADRIIRKVTENEADFRAALSNYVFNRYATINTIGLGGQITGTYRRDSYMTFSSDGVRFEKLTFFPVATTPPGFVTAEDLEDLGGVNPFALEPAYVNQYNFRYIGTERIDDLNLYVFDVTPKVIPDPKKSKQRLFTGRIWIDVDDLMIVKSRGKAVPETKDNKFPVVETTRQQIDGKYWFPADARSDDELVFDDGSVVKLRMRVRYTNYKVGRTEVRVLDEDETVVPEPTPTPTPKKP
jgi:hypothetical protein